MNNSEDAYEILGLQDDATGADIKRAYRKLALKYHPDKQTNEDEKEEAANNFAKVSNAYQILSDEENRRQYDIRKRMNGKAPSGGVSSTGNTSWSSPPTRQSSPRTKTTTRMYGRPSKQRTQSQHDVSGPENISFTFSTNSFDPRFDDPFEMFKKMYKEEYGKEFDPTDVTPQSPVKARRKKGPSVTISGAVPSSPNKKTVVRGSNLSPRRTVNVSPRKQKNSSSVSATFDKTGKQKHGGTTSSPTVVSMSSKASTISRADGTQETIVEKTESLSDGTVRTVRESKISSATKGKISRPKGRLVAWS